MCHGDREQVEYVSPIFITPKSDGGYRLILNLKRLNEEVVYNHFKMDNIKAVLQLVTPYCYMFKIDLKDAYYSVKVDKQHQSFLKFSWRGQIYKFVYLPNGLASWPQQFTKLLKVPLSCMRLQDVTISGYIDDFFTAAQEYALCQSSVEKVVALFRKLGFMIHPVKSDTEPKQEI